MYNWNIFLSNQNVSRVCSSYPKILNNHITICIWATTTTKRNETCKNLLLPYCYSTHYFFIIKNIRMFGLQISGKFQTRTIVKVNTSKWKRMHLIISFKWYSCIILRLMFVLHGVVPKRLVLVNGQCFYSKVTSIVIFQSFAFCHCAEQSFHLRKDTNPKIDWCFHHKYPT